MIKMDQINEMISDITGYDVESFTADDTLIEDLGFDSIMLMDLYHSLSAETKESSNMESLKEVLKTDITIHQLGEMLGVETDKQEYGKENVRLDSFPEVEEFANRLESVTEVVPYFRKNEGVAANRMRIEGREKINFSTYNYLGLNGDPRLNEAAKQAIEQYGTSVSGSRLLGGQIALHEALESKIAEFLGAEDSLVLVGGHATNVNVIASIVGEEDLILHDAMAHNSIVQGAILSHAKRKPFKHNNMQHLESELTKLRKKFRRVLIVVEGVYSMDGDICNLPELVRIKEQFGAILMVDEAHSFGTIGKNGRGVTSYYGMEPAKVDILMGTLSKSAASCGGYVAGCRKFIRHMRYNLEGFIFSCGSTPANTAAALKAIELFETEDARFTRLSSNADYFRSKVKELGYQIGLSCDTPIIPVIIGETQRALSVSQQLYERGVNVHPIVYPAVKEEECRLRFFMSASHTKEDMDETLRALQDITDETKRNCI